MDIRFPRWSAPFVGAGIGALLSLRLYVTNDPSPWWLWMLGPLLGAAAGLLILLLEPSLASRDQSPHEFLESVPRPENDERIQVMNTQFRDAPQAMSLDKPILLPGAMPLQSESFSESSLGGRLFAFLSLLLFWMPIVGWGLCLIALIANRHDRGWPRVVSWIASSVAAVEIVFLAALYFLAGPRP